MADVFRRGRRRRLVRMPQAPYGLVPQQVEDHDHDEPGVTAAAAVGGGRGELKPSKCQTLAVAERTAGRTPLGRLVRRLKRQSRRQVPDLSTDREKTNSLCDDQLARTGECLGGIWGKMSEGNVPGDVGACGENVWGITTG